MLLGIGLFVAGIASAIATLYRGRLGALSTSWPSVLGRITHAEATQVDWFTWDARVGYAYIVAATEYQGRDLSALGKRSIGSRVAKQCVAELPVGRQVTVYYDPQKPSRSFLEHGTPLGALLVQVLVGLVSVTFGIVCIIAIR